MTQNPLFYLNEDALIDYKMEFEKQPHSKFHFDLILKTEEKIKNLKKKLWNIN